MTRITRLTHAAACALGLALLSPAAATAEDAPAITTSVTPGSLPAKKQTQPGLYITAAEAAELLEARDDVILIDVRTPEETMFVGFPTTADANIPYRLVDPAHRLNPERGSYAMMDNPGFLPAALDLLEKADATAVLVMCRSGGRSASAVNTLTDAGLEVPLYSMVDGFEGDKNEAGKRTVNGWKNAGAPWTTKIPTGFLHEAD